MAKWQRTLRLNPEWDRAKDGDLPINELAGVIASRLKLIKPLGDDVLDAERDDLVEELEILARDKDATISDIDELMRRLYDWGDTPLDDEWNGKKACWIDTISA